MAASRLENLPVELLEQICEYVGDGSLRNTLLSFSLASKRIYSVARGLFFRAVKIRLDAPSSPLPVVQAVDICIAILERNSAFADVRTLVIDGRRRLKTYGTDGEPNSWVVTLGLPLTVPEVLEGDKDRLHGLTRRCSLVPDNYYNRMATEYTNPAQLDMIWRPLARLVQKLQAPTDLVYVCPTQVPPSLLVSLERQPGCRLHVIGFRLDSLLSPTEDNTTHDLALVRAPCLHSIWAWYEDGEGYDDDDRPSYYAEAITAMLQGLSPNLKEVHLFQEGASASVPEDYGGPSLPPCPPWKGFPNVEDVRCTPARLESFELHHPRSSVFYDKSALEGFVMDGWAANIQLSHLRSLIISRAVRFEALQTLIRAGNNFPYLTALVFTCDEYNGKRDVWLPTDNLSGPILPTDGPNEQELRYYNLVVRFIHRLPQLTSLEINKWHPSVSLAPDLAPGLRELWVRTRHVLGAQGLDEAAIRALAARCPLVKTLALTVHRSRGDATEVALYRAIGRGFSNLLHLDLMLDVSPPAWFHAIPPDQGFQMDTAVDPSFDEFDSRYLGPSLSPYRNGHVRDVFTNSAVDETLARAIFDTISYAQPVTLLKRMSLQVEGAKAFPNWGRMMPATVYLWPFLAVLRRRWLLNREVHHGARPAIHAQDIDRGDHVRRPPRDENHLEPTYLQIFRRIWPERPGGSAGLGDDWQSLPLAV